MGLGDRIHDWIDGLAEEWGERFGAFWGNVIGRGGREVVEEIDPELLNGLQQALKWVAGLEASPSARQIVEDLAAGREPRSIIPGEEPSDTPPISAAGIVTASALGTWIGSPLGLLPILTEISQAGSMEGYRQAAARLYRPTRLQVADAIRATFRGVDGKDWAGSDLAAMGFSDDRIRALGDVYRPLLTPDLVRTLTWRLPEQKDKLRAELTKAGYTEEQVKTLETLYEVIPPLADMVRFADFSAFDPVVIERWREFYDAPDWIREPFSKIGITDEWADRYWFSHWRQPGRFELGELHRRFLIEDDDARLAYQTQGYSQYWQDLLLKLVEEPLTRVDIRRMHDVGMLTDEDLSDAYHAVGFYGENNERMVEFTKRYNAGTQRSVTESKILKAYSNGDIGREVALELLQETGYTEDDADFVLATEEDDQVETKRDLTRTQVRDLYFAGINDRLETTDRLAAMGYDAEAVADMFDYWDLQQRAAVRTPTRTELTHFLGEGIITVETFVSRMQAEGYQPEHIDWYLQEHEADQVAVARKEEERARAEQERVAAAEERTAYQEERARLDVAIATLRTYIAEKRLAIRQTDDDALEHELREDIDRAQVEIAELREQKARLKL